MGWKDIMKDIKEGVEMSVLSLKDSVKAGGLAFARLRILSQHWKKKIKKKTTEIVDSIQNENSCFGENYP